MASGNGPVYLGLVLALAAIATSALRLWTLDRRLVNASRLLTVVLFAVVSAMVIRLYALFMSSDMSVFYVWQYSTTDLPDKFKFSAVLAGMAGSLLFWIWMVTIPWLTVELWAMRRRVDADLVDWTRIATLSVVALLMYILSLYNTFEPTPAAQLAYAPDGNGLSPLLQTDLMIVHPPVVFVAYGAMVIPFAAAFAGLVTGNKGWTGLSLTWSRIGWLFLTAGIGIGGLWAYVVLGWGGYWGWDPIETSSLLPWLILTGFLHTQLLFKRKGSYPLLAPVLGVMSFVLVVFATFATRAAGLWVSVHSYGSADLTVPAWDRFTGIMGDSPTVRLYVAFMVVSTALLAVLAVRTYLRTRRPQEERYIGLAELIDDDMLMFGTVTLLVITTVVTALILVGGVNGLDPENFNAPVGLLAMVGSLVLTVCLVWRHLGRRRVAYLAGGTGLAAVIGAVLFPGNVGISATAPILAVAVAGAGYKTVRSIDPKRLLPSLTLASAHLIHLSVVLILLGYVGSNFLEDDRILPLEVDGASHSFAGYDFRATDYRVTTDERYVEVVVERDGGHIATERPGQVMIDGKVRSEVRVVNRLAEDVYLIYGNSTVVQGKNVINVSVTILPLMYVLWAGMYLMMAGMVLRGLCEAASRRGRAAAAEAARDRTADRRRATGRRRRGAQARRASARGRAPEGRDSGPGKARGRPVSDGSEDAGAEADDDDEVGGDDEGEEEAEGDEEDEVSAEDDEARLEALLEEELKRM